MAAAVTSPGRWRTTFPYHWDADDLSPGANCSARRWPPCVAAGPLSTVLGWPTTAGGTPCRSSRRAGARGHRPASYPEQRIRRCCCTCRESSSLQPEVYASSAPSITSPARALTAPPRGVFDARAGERRLGHPSGAAQIPRRDGDMLVALRKCRERRAFDGEPSAVASALTFASATGARASPRPRRVVALGRPPCCWRRCWSGYC